ncbi:MAG: hypothetical protein WC848_00920 [Parcubacteria group bacterium]|jgi:hypothetical protein
MKNLLTQVWERAICGGKKAAETRHCLVCTGKNSRKQAIFAGAIFSGEKLDLVLIEQLAVSFAVLISGIFLAWFLLKIIRQIFANLKLLKSSEKIISIFFKGKKNLSVKKEKSAHNFELASKEKRQENSLALRAKKNLILVNAKYPALVVGIILLFATVAYALPEKYQLASLSLTSSVDELRRVKELQRSEGNLAGGQDLAYAPMGDEKTIAKSNSGSSRRSFSEGGQEMVLAEAIVASDNTTTQNASDATTIVTKPRIIQLTGALSGANGQVEDGSYAVRFAIYDTDRTQIDAYPSDTDSANRVWEETQTVTVKDGIFRVNLGQVTDLPIFTTIQAGQFFLGIRVGEDSEMAPRKRLATPLYALNAGNSLLLNGKKVGVSAGDIVALDAQGKIAISNLPTGTGSNQLLLGNDKRLKFTISGSKFLTLSGQKFTVGKVDLASETQGILPIASGGTGLSAFTSGDMLYYSSGSTFSKISAGTIGQVLSISADGTPAWGNLSALGHSAVTLAGSLDYLSIDANQVLTLNAIDLGTDVTGTLPTGNGGTGLSSYVPGDLLYYSSGGALTRLPIGSNGQIFGVLGGAPGWQNSPFVGAHNLLSLSHPDVVAASPLEGDMIVGTNQGGGIIKWQRMAVGSAGQFLSNTGSALQWRNTSTISSLGTVTAGIWNATPVTDAYVSDALTISGGTISGSNLTLVQSATPTPTAEGRIEWDVDNDQLVIGNGTGQTIITQTNLSVSGLYDYITLAGQDIVRGQIDLTTDVTGTLPISNGGTGRATFATNGILYGNGTSGINITAAGTEAQFVVANSSGVPVFVPMTGDVFIAASGASTIQPNSVALGTDTVGNYLLGATSGNGIAISGVAGEGWTASFALDSLTSNWNQTGAFDIVLANAGSELQIMESNGGAFYGTVDVGDLSANRTYTFPDTSGTLALTSDIHAPVTLAGQTYASIIGQAITFAQIDLASHVTGTLPVANGGTGATTFTPNGIVYGNGVGAMQITAAGSSGQILIANASSIPAFVTLGGDVTIIANGTATIANSAVGSAEIIDSSIAEGDINFDNAAGEGLILKYVGGQMHWSPETGGSGSSKWTDTGTFTYLTTTTNDLVIGGSATDTGFFFDISASTLTLEGATPDAYETTLGVLDPTADRAINFPNASGTVALTSDLHNSATLGGTLDYLTIDGNQVITRSAIDLATDVTGTLPVGNGGTGQITFATNGVLYGNGTSGISASTAGTSGQLIIAGATGTPVFRSVSGDINLTDLGVATIQPDAVALGSDTTGNYVLSLSNGNGIAGANGGSEGATLTLALGNLTSNWNQTGAFDIVLANAGSELQIMESNGGAFYGTVDVGDLSANRTYTFPDTSGTLALTSDIHAPVTLAGQTYASIIGQAITFAQIDLASHVTGTLPVANGGTGATTFTPNGIVYGNGVGAMQITAAGSSGQILIANASSIPAFVTLGGDVTIIANGTATIANSAVGSAEIIDSSIAEGDINFDNAAGEGLILKYVGGQMHWSPETGGSGSSKWTDTGTFTYLTTTTNDLVIGGSATDTGFFFDISASTLTLEGATPDAYETTLGVLDPTADRAINFPNASGTVALTSDLHNSATLGGTLDYLTIDGNQVITRSAIDLATDVTGTLPVGNGGTGQITFATNGVLYGNGTSGISASTAGTSGQLIIAGATGTPVFRSVSGDINLTDLGVATIQPDAVALGSDTTGNYVLSLSNGNGIAGANGGSEGATLTLALSNLTADWSQGGAYDLVLANASSELKIMESIGGLYYGIFDVANLSADQTYTFPNVSGTVALGIGTAGYPAYWSDANTLLAEQYVSVVRGGTGVGTFGGVNTILYTTSANTLSSIATANDGILVTGAGGAPSISTDLPTAVTIGSGYIYRAGGTDVSLADGGTGASLTDPNADRLMFWDDSNSSIAWLSGAANLNITGTVFDLASSVTLGSNGTSGDLTLYSEQGTTDYSVKLQPNGAMTQNVTFTLPANDGDASQVLITNGAGALTWSSVSGVGALDGTGFANSAAYWLDDNTLAYENQLAMSRGGTGANLTDPNADRLMFWDDSNSSIAWITANSGNLNLTGTTLDLDATIQLGADATSGSLTIYSEQGATDHTLAIAPNPAMTQDVTLTMPADDGINQQVLITDGNGALSWSSVSGVGGVTGTGTNGYATYWTGASSLAAEQYLSVTRGGTGAGTYATNGVLYGNGTGALQATTAGTETQFLVANATGVPTFVTMSGDVTISAAGVASVGADRIALTTQTTGNYVATVASGNGLTGGSAGSEGATLTLALSNLTANWNQSGAFDIILGNAGSELQIMESSGNTYYGTVDVGDLSANQTYTFPNASGTIALTTDLHNSVTLAGTLDYLTLDSNQVLTRGAIDLTTDVTGTLPVSNGGTGRSTLTNNGVIYGLGSSAVGMTSAGTSGQILIAGATGTPTFQSVSGDINLTDTGTATIQSNSVALTTDTTGNYVATLTNGNGITGANGGSEGATLTLALGSLTSNWTQAGAFDIVLANAGSELQIMESTGDTFYGTLDVADLSANQTYTFPNATGSVALGTGVANQLAYWSGTNALSGVTSGNNGLLVTNGSGVPSIATDIPTAVTIGSSYIYRAGGTDISVADGGTGRSTLTTNGVLYGLGASAVGMTTAGTDAQLLIAGATGVPTFRSMSGDMLISNLGVATIQSDAIGSSEISDSTIAEADLSATNGPTAGYVLSYNSGGGFTWIVNDGGSGGSKWTDSGSGFTYLTATTNNLLIGGSTADTGFFFDISASTFTFEGATPDAYETTVGVLDPTADRAINFPNASGTIALTTDLHNSVTLAGTLDYLTLDSNQVLTRGAIDLTTDVTGTLPVSNGGTGRSTLTNNGVIYGLGSSAVGMTSAGTSGQILIAGATGTPTFQSVSGDINLTDTGTATIQSNSVALTTDTTGNYVATLTNGNGITGANGGSEGATLTLALGSLTSNWTQAGAFDIVLANAGSELQIMESTGDTFYGTLDVADLSANQTYTFPNATGSVALGTGVANQLAYWSGTNALSGVTSGNNGLLVTNGSGVPSIATDIPTAVTIGSSYIYRAGGTDISVADGGTGRSTLTTNGVLYGLGASAVGMTTAGTDAQLLIAGATGVPTFRSMSGDMLISNLGVATIQSDAIGSSEISDSTIAEADLSATNGPTAGYVLSYNSGGGFTWIVNDGGSGGSKWSDGGAFTFLTDTADSLMIGGSAVNSSAFYFNLADANYSDTQTITFEGSGADDNFETRFIITNPTADRDIVFKNEGGTVAYTTDIHTALTLAGTLDYITLDGNQVLTRNAIDLATDVTGLLGAGNGGTGLNTGSATGVPTLSSGTWSINATLGVATGGTGVATEANLENKIEAYIFDADSENISGVWTLADNTALRYGADGNFSTSYNGTSGNLELTDGTNLLASFSDAGTVGNLRITGGISTYDKVVTAGYGEFAGLCLGNGTSCITTWGAAGAISGSGTAGSVAYWSGANALTAEPQLATSRGGTGIDTASSSGMPMLTAGTWSITHTPTLGMAGTSGALSFYSEQGALDYSATLSPNSAMTSSAHFYLPSDEPIATYLLSMTSGGVMGFDTNSYLVAPSTPAQGDVLYYNGTSWVNLPAGTDGYYLQTRGVGVNPRWAEATAGSSDWTRVVGTPSLSYLTDTASDFAIGGTTLANSIFGIDTSTARMQIGNAGITGSLALYSEVGATDYTLTLQPSASMTQNTIYTFPVNDGDPDQVLVSNGSGVLEWKTVNGISGAGDITAIGNVTGGDAFTASGTAGTQLYFYDADGRGQLTIADLTQARTYTLPNADGTVALGTGTQNYVARWTGANNLSTGVLYDNGTNVGIGTTSPATRLDLQNTDYKQLRLWNTNSLQQLWIGSVYDSVGSFIGNNAYYHSNLNFTPNYSAASGINFNQNGGTEFWNNSGLTSGVDYIPTRSMVILSNGNIGIGTTDPTYKLHVGGATFINSNLTVNSYIMNANGGPASPSYTFSNGQSTGLFLTGSNNALGFSTVGAEAMRINSSGNVGIGTTNPLYKLHVNGNIGGDAIYLNGLVIGNNSGQIASNAGENLYFAVGGTTLEKMRLTTDGNLGIGTTNPLQKLSIAGTMGILEGGSTPQYYTILQGADQTADITYTLPGSYPGGSGYVLTSAIDGAMSWSAAGTGGIGDITGIGNVTSGDAFTATGTAGTQLYFYDADGRGQLTIANLTAVQTYTLPDATGTFALGTGTQNYVARWTGANNLSTGVLYDDGTNVGIGTTNPTQLLAVADNQFTVSSMGALVSQSATIGQTVVVPIVVSGNGGGTMGSPNGTYVYMGQHNGKNYYQFGVTWYIWWSSGDNTWYIGSYAGDMSIDGIGPDNSTNIWYSNTTGATPPLLAGGWNPKYSATGNPTTATGSAPLIVMDTAGNLSMGGLLAVTGSGNSYFNGGNVGIGTVSPVQLFQVNSSATASFVVTSAGQVGIGTTNPLAILHLNGGVGSLATGLAFGDGDSGIYEDADDSLMINLNGGGAWSISSSFIHSNVTNGAAILHATPSGTIPGFTFFADQNTGVGTADADILSLIAGGTNGLNVTSAGNVGIGTTAPGVALDIVGNLRVFASGAGLYMRSSNLDIVNSNGTESINWSGTGAGSSLYFRTANADRMWIANGGNVGIGTTNPLALLSVGATSQFQVNALGEVTAVKVNGNTISSGSGTLGLSTYTLNLTGDANLNQHLLTTSSPSFAGLTVTGAFSMKDDQYFTLGDSNDSIITHRATPVTANTAVSGLIVGTPTVGALGANSTVFSNITGGDFVFIGANGLGNSQELLRLSAANSKVTMGSGTTAMIIDANGFVGIGTTAPSQLLQVNNSGANAFVVTAAGNVGIGTTSPGVRLDIGGNSQSITLISARGTGNGLEFGHPNAAGYGSAIGSTYSSGYPYLVFNGEQGANGDTFITRGIMGRVLMNNVSAGILSFGRLTNVNASGQTPTSDLVINSSGNIGIGTTAPVEILDVNGRLHLAQTTAPTPTTDRLYNVGGNLLWNGINLTGGGSLPTGITGQTLYSNAGTWTATSNLYNDGTNVGIGMTSPQYILDVDGQSRIRSNLFLGYSNYLYFGATGTGIQGSDSGSQFISFMTAGSDRMFISSTGNVGIGTTNPTRQLEIGGVANPAMGVVSSSSAGYYATFAVNYDATHPFSITSNALEIFGRYANSATVLGLGGNVGIGTTNPGYKLDVYGTGSFDGKGTDPNVLVFKQSGGVQGYLKATNGIGLQGETAAGGNAYIYGGTGNGLFVSNAGNIGIGTTAPGYKLHVTGSTDNYLSYLYNSNTGNSAGGLYVRGDGLGNLFTLNYAGTDVFTVSGAQTTFSNPVSFASAGNVTLANDLVMANPMAGNIRFSSQGYIATESGWEDLNLNLSAANNGYVIVSDTLQNNLNIGSTAPGTNYGIYQTLNNTGIVTTGVDTTYGLYQALSRTGATGGTINSYGIYSNVTADNAGTGTSTAIGGYFSASGADNNFALITGNGNVGIGTTNPTEKLSVTGNISASGNVSAGNAFGINGYGSLTWGTMLGGNSPILTSGNSLGFSTTNMASLQMVINSSGNVGIGTTNPTRKLDIVTASDSDVGVYTNGYIRSGNLFMAGGAAGLFNNSVSDGGLIFDHAIDNSIELYSGVGGNVAFATNGDSSNYSMLINAAGNVGIGTTAPGYKLHVTGSTDNYLSYLYNSNTGNSAGGLYVRGDGLGNLLTLNYAGTDVMTVSGAQTTFSNPVSFASAGNVAFSNDLVLTNSTAGNIRFQGAGYVVTESGWQNLDLTLSAANDGFVVVADTLQNNLNIGSTAPGTNYGIYQTLNNTGIVTTGVDTTYGLYQALSRTGATGGTINSYGVYSNVTGDTGGTSTAIGGYFSASGADNNFALITGNGNVGIGTTAPGYQFVINNPNSALMQFIAGDGGYVSGSYFGSPTSPTRGSILYQNNSGIDDSLNITSVGVMSFVTQYLERMRILANGNVGIGTTDPGAKLDVNGSILATSIRLGSTYSIDNTGFYISDPALGGIGSGGQTPNGAYSWFISSGDNTTHNDGFINLDTSGSERMRIDASGNIGIGTTAPTYKLHVTGSTDNYLSYLYNSNTGNSAGGLYVRGDGLGSLLTLNYAGSDVMTVTGAQTTFSNPVSFASAGNVSLSNDLLLTNATAGNIRFKGPGYVVTESSWQNLNLTLSAANDGFVVVDDTLQNNLNIGTTAPGTNYGIYQTLSNTGIVTTGVDTTYGLYQALSRTGATGGTINSYGIYSNVTGDTGGTSTAIGGYFSASGADNNFALITGSGNVGIGTTNPGYALDVNGNSRIENQTGATTFIVQAGIGQSSTNLLEIKNNTGSVVTYFNASGNLYAASVNGGSAANLDSNGIQLSSTSSIAWSQGGYAGTLDIGLSRLSSGVLAIGNGTQGNSIGTLIAGNVGIGTTAPSYKLQLAGSVDSYLSSFYNSATTASAGGLYIRSDGLGNLLTLDYAGTDVMTVSGAQTTFSNPVSFASAGNVSFANDLLLTNEDTGNLLFQGPGNIATDSSWQNLDLTLSAANLGEVIINDDIQINGSRFNVNASGNVGIGTTNPMAKVQVANYNGYAELMLTSQQYYSSGIYFGYPGAEDVGSLTFSNTSDYIMSLKAGLVTINDISSVEKMRIDTVTGNVGIGTTDPTSKLYVVGDIYTTANLSALTITDRTAYPKTLDQAYEAVLSMQRLPDGEYDENDSTNQLDHSKLSDFILASNGERDLSASVSSINEVTKYLLGQIGGINNPIALSSQVKQQETQIASITQNQNQIVAQLTGQLADQSLSVDNKLQLIGETLSSITADTQNLETQTQQIADLQAQLSQQSGDLLALQTQMDDLKVQAQGVMDFADALDINKETGEINLSFVNGKITAGSITANSILLNGQLEAESVVAGAFSVKIVDAAKKTLGDVVICEAGKIMKNGICDVPVTEEEIISASDGKTVKIDTTAVSATTKIFITPEGDAGGRVWVEKQTDVVTGEYTGFKIKCSDPIIGSVKVNWWIVEEK